MDWGRQGDVIYVPKFRSQLVAARTVAEALADLATSPEPAPAPGSPIPEIAGPREENLADMAVLLAARREDPVKIEAVTNPADPDHELYEAGGLLPGPDATLAGPTFEEWLDSQISGSPRARRDENPPCCASVAGTTAAGRVAARL